MDLMAFYSNTQQTLKGTLLPHIGPSPTPLSSGISLFAQNPLHWKDVENHFVSLFQSHRTRS